MWLGIRLEGWLTILAIISGPLIALEVQKWLEDRRAHQNRKMDIFRRLMTTRQMQMAPAHVEALNGIEVEFYSKVGRDKKVLEAWRLYLAHLNSPKLQGEALIRWAEKKNDLLIDLLYGMAQSLKYDFDKVALQKNAYYPQGFIDIEAEQHALRKAALEVFRGERPLTCATVGTVQVAGELPLPEEIDYPRRQNRSSDSKLERR